MSTEIVEQHRKASPTLLGFALITVSDTRTPENDEGGLILASLAIGAGHRVELSRIVPDDIAAIQGAVQDALDIAGTGGTHGVDVIVLSGGTGFSPRDVTVEAVTPLIDKPIEGFGELFRMLSWQQVGSAAMLSRATAGLIGLRTDLRAIFLLPGSPKAVALAMEKLILPEAGHLLGQVRKPV